MPLVLGEQKQSESKLGRQTSVDSKVLSALSSSGQQLQASVDDSLASQQKKWTRQVSWMAEKSRNITQAALVLDDDDADVPKFQAHQIWQEKEDVVSFRSSRRQASAPRTSLSIPCARVPAARSCWKVGRPSRLS